MNSQYITRTYKRMDIVLESGQGSWLKDNKGETYLDMVAGVAVNALGHNHPEVVKIIQQQASKMLHVSNIYWTQEQGDLAKKLVGLSDHKNVFFCNSGSEAVEGAMKTAKKYGHLKSAIKNKIICFDQSFHGRTIGSLSVTAQKKYQMYFEPLMTEVLVCEFNNIDDVKSKALEEVCGIIIEPIQGEGGIKEASKAFLKELKDLCEANDILLIFDEVQCGAGRLGTFFAYETFDVIPDIVCMAKGLGGGVPIGAFIVNAKADVLTYGDHGCTYGGNPLVCAVSKTVIDITSQSSFLNDVKEKSVYLMKCLEGLKEKYDSIKKVRGQGLMIGIVLGCPASEIIKKAQLNKLLLISAGENIIRIVPPLNITYEEIDIFVEKLSKALES